MPEWAYLTSGMVSLCGRNGGERRRIHWNREVHSAKEAM